MSQKQIVFECRAMPGLLVMQNGRRYKFVGGKIAVAPSEAADIRKYAAARPHLKITEVGAADEPPTDAEPTAEPKPFANMRMTHAELVTLAESRGMTYDAAEPMTKHELVDAINAPSADE